MTDNGNRGRIGLIATLVSLVACWALTGCGSPESYYVCAGHMTKVTYTSGECGGTCDNKTVEYKWQKKVDGNWTDAGAGDVDPANGSQAVPAAPWAFSKEFHFKQPAEYRGVAKCGTGDYSTCVYVTAIRVDLDVTGGTGVTEAKEATVGALVVKKFDSNNAPRKKITLRAVEPSSWSGDIVLTRSNAKVKVFTAATGGTEITFDGTDNKSATNSLPKDWFVEGAEYSASMRDVELKADPVGLTGCEDTVTCTVLWVDTPTVNVSTTVSSDNDKKDNYKAWAVANTYDLGVQLYNATYVARMGWGSEAGATVHPSGFDYPGNDLKLDKDLAYHDWIGNGTSTIDSQSFSASVPPGNDTDDPGTRDDNPAPGGVIYDFDAAGLTLPTAAQNEIRRTRNNFKAFASITIDGTAIRCSPVREYFIRFSMKQLDAPTGSNWAVINPPDVTDDKQAGNGSTNLSWNLQ